jgi:hypothetical protein
MCLIDHGPWGSDASVRLGHMLDEPQPSDNLYYALAQIDSWTRLQNGARRWVGTPMNRHVGELMSSLLLATSDATTVLTLAAHLKDDAGYIAMVTTSGLIYADIRSVTGQGLHFTVEVHPLDAVDQLGFAPPTTTSMASTESRHGNIEFTISFAGHTVTFAPARHTRNALTSSDAVLQAFFIIRDH